MRELSAESLRTCLVTEQRDKVTLGLGAIASPNCGEAPFDKKRWSARLFSLPWTRWPIYDEAVLKLDLERIERWYQARGFYGVRVMNVDIEPQGARAADVCKEKDCTLDVTVHIDEGEPVKIRKLAVEVAGELTPELRESIEEALPLRKGDIFDEAEYDIAREALADVLRQEGYARAAVMGEVVINRGLLVADILLKVTPGPVCHFGEIRLESKGELPEEPVRAAALLSPGQLYEEDELQDAQRAIYALGAFSAVTVRGALDEGDGPEIPIVIELEPRREHQWQVGAGITSGQVSTGVAAQENLSVPQWDVHLLGSYENRNFFGGLRSFRIEERPRMLFTDQFPIVPESSPRFGNTITADFSQPGVIDGRTNLFLETRWDNGPDPFLLFFRNDAGVSLGLERGFFKQRLNARISLNQDVMQVSKRQPIREQVQEQLETRWAEGTPMAMVGEEVTDDGAILYDPVSSYRLSFIEQRISLDLRDDAADPTKGAYFRVSAHEAVKIWDPSWNYIRLTPEARGYVPLGLGIVLAARFGIGWMKVLKFSSELDSQSQTLGAQTYRLRGGGANSVRGFLPGDLGDGRTGGTHRWEASLELRIPLSKNFSIVGFGDVGDVNSGFDVIRTYRGRACPSDAVEGECTMVDRDQNPLTPPGGDGKEADELRTGKQLEVTQQKHEQGFRWTHLNTTVGGGLRYKTVIGPIRLDVGYRPKALAGDEKKNEKLQQYDRSERQFSKFRGAVHITIGESF